MKRTIKKAIHDAVRDYINARGGRITPTSPNPNIDIELYGENVEHEVVAMETTSEGVVMVLTKHEGENDIDEYATFGNDEMVKIAELFY